MICYTLPLINIILPLIVYTQVPAIIQYNLESLTFRLSANSKFDWISRRIQRSWPSWSEALQALEKAKPFSHSKKRVSV